MPETLVYTRVCLRCKADKPAVDYLVKESYSRLCNDCRRDDGKKAAQLKRNEEAKERHAYMVRVRQAKVDVIMASPNAAFVKKLSDVNAILDDWLVDLIDSRGYLGSDRQAKALRALLTEYKSFTRSNRNELLRMNRVLKVVRDDKRLGTMNAIEGRAKNQQRAVWALRCVAMDIMQDKSAWGEFTDYYHRN